VKSPAKNERSKPSTVTSLPFLALAVDSPLGFYGLDPLKLAQAEEGGDSCEQYIWRDGERIHHLVQSGFQRIGQHSGAAD
jgi:hypothetical protein